MITSFSRPKEWGTYPVHILIHYLHHSQLKHFEIKLALQRKFNCIFSLHFNGSQVYFVCFTCSGEGIVFTLDELTGALVVSHKLIVSSRDFPGTHCDFISAFERDILNGKLLNWWIHCGPFYIERWTSLLSGTTGWFKYVHIRYSTLCAIENTVNLICAAYVFLSDASQVCGAVSEMKWTPDGRAVAMSWKLGGFALWSVFGTLLHCTAAASSSGLVQLCSLMIAWRRLNDFVLKPNHTYSIAYLTEPLHCIAITVILSNNIFVLLFTIRSFTHPSCKSTSTRNSMCLWYTHSFDPFWKTVSDTCISNDYQFVCRMKSVALPPINQVHVHSLYIRCVKWLRREWCRYDALWMNEEIHLPKSDNCWRCSEFQK